MSTSSLTPQVHNLKQVKLHANTTLTYKATCLTREWLVPLWYTRRERQRDRDREISYLLADSPDAHKSQCWARPPSGEPGIQVPESPPTLSQGTRQQEAGTGSGAGTRTRALCWGMGASLLLQTLPRTVVQSDEESLNSLFLRGSGLRRRRPTRGSGLLVPVSMASQHLQAKSMAAGASCQHRPALSTLVLQVISIWV